MTITWTSSGTATATATTTNVVWPASSTWAPVVGEAALRRVDVDRAAA